MSKSIIQEIIKQNTGQQKKDFEGLINSVKTKTKREIAKYTGMVEQYQTEINQLYQTIQAGTQELQTVEQRIKEFEHYVRKKANLSPTVPIPKLRIWTGNFWEFDARDTRGLYQMQARLRRNIGQSNSYISSKQSCLQIYQKELGKWSR
jgi:hypothetical protein